MTLNAPIAIIGMGCLFPKSPGLKEYWRLIFHGTDGISEVPETHWLPDEYFDKDPKKPDHVCCSRGGFLSPVSFDPTEFGIPPSILEATDTSQLLGLVAAKMALEDSGYGEGKTYDRDRTSVILGVTGTQELVIPLSGRLGRPNWRKALSDSDIPPQKIEEIITKIADTYPSWQESSFPGLLGNVVAGRIANRLDLGGTNCVVDAACASSLGALNIAILELITGRSDMVITGGVDTLNDIFMHMCFARSLVLSPTGDARPFSKYADGTVLGEGVGILVLKRLEDAERDNDRIYCIIKGLGSSSDGRSQSVYSPNENGQIKALQAAYRNAGIDPSTVKLMEAHGTGTRVGDLVEFRALSRVFGKSEKTDKCALGSVKSMIGHTKAAAGTAAIIKAALSLWNKVLPPTLKAEEPDPKLNISESPFYLSRETRPWLSNKKHPRRAAVSSFGFGGSNFHVVLEEHDKKKTHVSWDGSVEIFAFSATTWQKVAENLQHLKIDFDNGLSELEFSNKASETRAVFSFVDPFRLLLVFERSVTGTRNSIENFSALLTDALNTLESNGSKNFYRTRNIFWGRSEKPGKLAFAFPGQGSQYVGMGRDLVCGFPEAIQILNDFNEKYENRPLLSDFIYPNPATGKEEREIQEKVLRRTDIAQPAIGAISLAMLKILQKFGIKADATCGHSYGELPALYAAGWMDIDALAYLSITRGKLMAAAGKDPEKNNGTMLAVKAPLEAIADLISENKLDVVLANKNSPDQGVLSGSIDAIARAKMICDQKGFGAIHLPVSAAFHSRLVKSAQKPFMQALKKVEITAGDIPVFSNTTGKAYPTEPEKAKKLLGEQILCPVDFVSEIKNLYRMGVRTFVEVGPKSILTGLIQSIITDEYVNIIPLDASIGKGYGTADFARAICHLASIGYPVELNHWESLSKKPIKQRMSIPLSGANYRAELKTETGRKKQRETLFHHPSRQVTDPEGGLHDAKLLAGAGLETEKKQGEFVGNRSFTQTADTVSDPKTGVFNVNPIFENRNIMDKADSQKNPEFILDALKVVQEGLKSIQFLQMQTAETHKKFLETQAQAGRTLQEMMENTRRLAEASMGLNPSAFLPKKAHSTGRKPSSVAPYSNPEKNSGFCDSTKISTVSRAPEVHADASGEGSNVEKLKENVKLSNKEFETVEQVLLSVVGELTGYPVEMLSPDMDIEADLGIDSIKRVEILSAMEEKMPGLPLSPETMASMKTLRQITEHLVKAGKNDSISVAEENAKKPSEKNRSSHLRTETVEQVLLSVVGELTGYPVEMLSPDMDIEADLGIDSIKRVEILSAMEEKMPGLPLSPETMASMKTLRQITEHLVKAGKNDSHQNDVVFPELSNQGIDESRETQKSAEPPSEYSFPKDMEKVERKIVSIVPAPFKKGKKLTLPAGRTVFITREASGLSEDISDRLKSMGIDCVLVSPDVTEWDRPPAGGLIIVQNNRHDTQFFKNALMLANRMGLELIDSAAKGGAIFATISRLDGAFGFKGQGVDNPVQGCLSGLAKTAAIEWKGVGCRAFDVSPDFKENKDLATTIAGELIHLNFSDPIEIGLSPDRRLTLQLESSLYPKDQRIRPILEPADVVIVTGGARGVTASASYALARHSKPTLILFGRSPRPFPEPEWLKPLADEAEIKKAIFDNELLGEKKSPKLLETAFKRYSTNREISKNLEALQSLGVSVSYYSVDIRDSGAVKLIMDEVRLTHGPIKALIHGAGVLEDGLIINKTAAQFEKVFETKVKGFQALLAATKSDDLKHIVVFSSVAARTGNKGQSDYAMANEALNKIAQQEAANRPDCRVKSINWGPWDGGMVTPLLKREFERNNIRLIPMEIGTMCMLYEMATDKRGPVEVVIGADFNLGKEENKTIPFLPVQKKGASAKLEEKLSLTFKREIDVQRYPVLESHVLDGKPVVPFALITEWLGHGALHENPGLFLHGFDDLRLLKGIKLDAGKRVVRLLTGKTRKKGAFYEVDVEVRDGIKDGKELIHYKAKAILTETPSKMPLTRQTDYPDSNGYSRTMEEVYEKILFHGSNLRGIQKIISCSSHGMVAKVSCAPPPHQWITDPLRSKWIADPLVLDCAFQMATLWCYEEMGMVSLPSYSASYRQYCIDFPSDGVTAVLKLTKATDYKMTGDFTFLGSNHEVVARLNGYEAVMDASLFKAFKP